MFILEVIPLASFPPQVPQLLSYFFNSKLSKGSVVEISLGNRKVPAVVVSSSGLEDNKANLKKSSFQVKKISGVLSETPLVSDIQFKIAIWLSKNYMASLGLCLKTVLPPFFLDKKYPIKVNPALDHKGGGVNKPHESIFDSGNGLKPKIILSEAKNIIKNIEPAIKKVLTQKKRVLIVTPEISTAQYLYDYFAGYYETALVHGKVKKFESYSSWNKISSGEAEIIIGTRQALFSPLSDPGLIILEDPANEAYKSDMSPKYDTVRLALKISEIYSCSLVLVSRASDIRSYSEVKNNNYDLDIKLSKNKAGINLVDMVQEIKSGNFRILSRKSKEKLAQYIENGKKILIFSSRKGYAGAFMCENCGVNFKCSNCSIPFKYHKTPFPMLVCHRCSVTHKVPEFCPNCNSHKLKSVSFAGSQKIEEEINYFLFGLNKKAKVFVLDSVAVDTSKKETEILREMEDLGSFICIATQMIFSHRYLSRFDLVVVPNVDSLTTIPDFRSEEQLFYQFNKLLDFEPEEILLQTYHSESSLLDMLVQNNYGLFYDKELPVRKIFGYPPFTRLIKLSFRHINKFKASDEARILSEKLKMAILQNKLDQDVRLLDPSPAFVEREKNYYIYNIILKISEDQRPDEVLRFVPSSWIIDVDPKSIL